MSNLSNKEILSETNKQGCMVTKRDEIFISHRTTDSDVADMIKDFLVNTGIPNEKIFCSSLPGNDVEEKISPEVKTHLQKAAIIVLLLSRDFYASAYCINEAGIAWYLDDVCAIPIGLPEIKYAKMQGFLNSDYRLRRLSDDCDIAYLIDKVQENLEANSVNHRVVTRETKKLIDRYNKYISDRKEHMSSDIKDSVDDLKAENARLRKIIEDNDLDGDEDISDDEDIFKDGYHEIKNSNGEILKKGNFASGKLIDGIEYNVIIKVIKGEEENEKPVPFDELKKENWHYCEYDQYKGLFHFVLGHKDIIETGLQFFYVVDKKVNLEGKQVKPTFTNFRALESFLAEKEPDELDYIKTGTMKYDETKYADIELE